MSARSADVAVVGLGPVGGIMALLLAHAGLSVVVLDREDEALQLPRGVGIDGEIMRVVQTLGLADQLEPLLKVFRGTQYLDADGNVVSTRPGITGPGPQGWPARYNCHQPELEGVFRAALAARPDVSVLAGHEVTAVTASATGVTVSATRRATGQETAVTARYAVGCDGARSVTRKAAGLALEDFGLNQPWLVADFKVSETANLPGINTHYADPESPAIYIHVVRDLRRFEFRARPGEDLAAAVEPAAVWARVARWLTPDQAELLRAAVYTHRSLVARQWRAGPIVLAGDAAHQTPPFLGQGLCTGVRDAASLAWRLRAIIRDGAGEELLDSYSAERGEHARFYIKTSTSLGSALSAPDKKTLDALNRRVGREGRGAPPRLGDGLFEAGGPGGTLAPQPRLADGRLLDDVTGYRFAAVATGDVLRQVPAGAGRGRVALVEATGDAAAWLAGLGASAALVRPDRYYYGAYASAAAITEAIEKVTALIAPALTTTREAR